MKSSESAETGNIAGVWMLYPPWQHSVINQRYNMLTCPFWTQILKNRFSYVYLYWKFEQSSKCSVPHSYMYDELMSVKRDTVPWTLPWLTGYNTQWQLDSYGPLSTYTSEALESHSTTGKGAGMLINLHVYGHVFKEGWNKCMNCTFQKIIKSKNN